MTRFSEDQKTAIYADLRAGENVKQLCARHNIRANIMYSWLKKKNPDNSKLAFEPLELIEHSQSAFATIRYGNKELIFHQAVPLSHLKDLLLC
jgi:transposase-like protein